MFNYKNLIIVLASAIAILCVVVLFTIVLSDGKNDSSSSSSADSTSSHKVAFSFDSETLPEGYVAVLGYEDVYKIIKDGEITGYKIKTPSGKYEDYDMNKPNNYKVFDEEQQIYQAVDSDNKVIYYRKFNGKEWNVVNKEGDILLEVPEDYIRADDSQELYIYKDKDNKEIMRKITKFGDGSFAWNTVDNIMKTTTTTTTTTNTSTATTTTTPKSQSATSKNTNTSKATANTTVTTKKAA